MRDIPLVHRHLALEPTDMIAMLALQGVLQEVWANELALVIGLNAPTLRILQRCAQDTMIDMRGGIVV